jgi:branched-subunit amino acid transport protein
MKADLLVLFLLAGAGVYLTRVLPLLGALRRQAGEPVARPKGFLGSALRFVGPSVIAALLVSSVLPQPGQGSLPVLLTTAIALVPTVLVAVRFANLGLTVLAGVLAYWLTWILI